VALVCVAKHRRGWWIAAAPTGGRRARRATRSCARRQPARRRRRRGNTSAADGTGARPPCVRARGARAGGVRRARPDSRQGCADDDCDQHHHSTGEGAHHRGGDRGPASVSRQRRTIGGQAVRLSRGPAGLDRRVVHGGLYGRVGPAEGGAMSSPEATPTTTTSSRAAEPSAPGRPSDATNGALFDAIATEHATIYGYGLVSPPSTPELNGL